MNLKLLNLLRMADPAEGGGEPEKKKATVKVVCNEPLAETVNGERVVAAKGQTIEIEKSRVKSLGPLVTVAAMLMLLLCCFTAQAQQYQSTTLLDDVIINASTTSNYTASVTLTKHDNVALLWQFKHMGAGTDNCILTLEQSIDGTNWETTNKKTITVAATGTTQVNVVTNLSMGAVGYLRVKSVQNGVADVLTNLTVKVVTKPKKNG